MEELHGLQHTHTQTWMEEDKSVFQNQPLIITGILNGSLSIKDTLKQRIKHKRTLSGLKMIIVWNSQM